MWPRRKHDYRATEEESDKSEERRKKDAHGAACFLFCVFSSSVQMPALIYCYDKQAVSQTQSVMKSLVLHMSPYEKRVKGNDVSPFWPMGTQILKRSESYFQSLADSTVSFRGRSTFLSQIRKAQRSFSYYFFCLGELNARHEEKKGK